METYKQRATAELKENLVSRDDLIVILKELKKMLNSVGHKFKQVDNLPHKRYLSSLSATIALIWSKAELKRFNKNQQQNDWMQSPRHKKTLFINGLMQQIESGEGYRSIVQFVKTRSKEDKINYTAWLTKERFFMSLVDALFLENIEEKSRFALTIVLIRNRIIRSTED